MSNINELVLEESFLKKHGKKLLLAGGLAALGAGGLSAHKHLKKQEAKRKNRRNALIGAGVGLASGGLNYAAANHVNKTADKWGLDRPFSTRSTIIGSIANGAITGGMTHGIAHLLTKKK